MMSCWLDDGTQPGAWAAATDTTASVKRIETATFPDILTPLKLEPHRGRDQPRLAQVRQIAAAALSRDAAGAQGGPVMHIGQVVCRDPPGGQYSHRLGGVADAEIEGVVLGRVGAVDVVDRAASYMLPIEIQEGAGQPRQVVLGQQIGFVVG